MRSIRRYRLLALVPVMVLWLLPSAAETIGDPPGPVELVESPPIFGSCPPPISTVSGLRGSRQGADVFVTNKTMLRAVDYMTLEVTVDGERRLFWFSIDLLPGASTHFSVRYLATVDLPAIGICGQKPGGIVDSEEPVLAVVPMAP